MYLWFSWVKIRKEKSILTNSYEVGGMMDSLQEVWFLPSENTWKDLHLLAWKDKGVLEFFPEGLTFTGTTDTLTIKNIETVRYGRQGRDFINNWVRIEYRINKGDTTLQEAFFADGRCFGWSGIFGGTRNLFKRIQRIQAGSS